MHNIKNTLSRQFNVEAEVLHFDYNQDMLNANYEKTLVLGCHADWKVGKIVSDWKTNTSILRCHND